MKGIVSNANILINCNVAKIAAAVTAISILANPAGAQTRHKKVKNAHVNTAKSAVLSVVSYFKADYKRKDKKTMSATLMVPCKDAETLEKRYLWMLRFGLSDMPNSRPHLMMVV